MRWKGYGPHTISFGEKKVPDVAPPIVLEDQDHADKTILEKLKEVCTQSLQSAVLLLIRYLLACRRTSYLDQDSAVQYV